MGHDHHHDVREATLGPTDGASVVIDVGGDTGALVVYTPGALAGREIEIRRVPGAWTGAHTAVRARRLAHDVVWAACFAALVSGRHEVRVRGSSSRAVGVEVTGGRVTEISW